MKKSVLLFGAAALCSLAAYSSKADTGTITDSVSKQTKVSVTQVEPGNYIVTDCFFVVCDVQKPGVAETAYQLSDKQLLALETAN